MEDGSISLIIPTVLINAVLAHRQVRERAGASNQHNTDQPRTHCFLPCGGVGWGVPGPCQCAAPNNALQATPYSLRS